MKKLMLASLVLIMAMSTAAFGSGTDEQEMTLVFGDLSWNSVQVHNRIAAFIIENGIGGYKAEFTAADTLVTINGMIQGDIDIDMESWHSNFREAYEKGIATGEIVDLGKNLPDGPQGWWVPRYLIEGDDMDDASAPDLKSVEDLKKNDELFTDPEDPKRSVVFGVVAGWQQLEISEKIFNDFGLEEQFNLSVAGSGSALAATMVAAYEKHEAWVGYYWAPTAILGRLDMVRLEGSEFEPADVNILVHKSMLEKAPEVVEFLKNYSTDVDMNNEFLAKMDTEQWDTEQTAIWFLKNKESVWTEWVDDDVEAKVKEALAAL
jgi:glycine betaine/proline transport system substrate-binding protein